MNNQSNREKVLKAIRSGLINKTESPFREEYLHRDVFSEIEEDIDIHFAQKFTQSGGKFIFCQNELDFAEKLVDLSQHLNWKQLICVEPLIISFLLECEIPFSDDVTELDKCEVLLSTCESLIARNGSLVISTTQLQSEKLWHQSEIHIVIAYNRQVVMGYNEALKMVSSNNKSQKPDQLTIINGPAKCQNYDPALELKGIGPSHLYLFLIESENPNE